MREQDLPAAVQLSREVGWPHRIEDWQFALDVGQGVVAETEDGLLGTAMWWRFGDEVASLGMVIVTEAARGLGIARTMMEEILRANPDHTLFLNGTEAGLPLYRKLGFVESGIVHQRQGICAEPGSPKQNSLRRLTRNDLAAAAALDAASTGYERRAFLYALFEIGECVGLDDGAQLAGYGFCRQFGFGYLIGPVIAADTEIARRIIGHWLAARAGAFVRIDLAEHDELLPFVEAAGLTNGARVQTMVRGLANRPSLGAPRPRLVAVANQAFG